MVVLSTFRNTIHKDMVETLEFGFFCFMQQYLTNAPGGGHAIIAGSFPLVLFMKSINHGYFLAWHKVEANDCDIFVSVNKYSSLVYLMLMYFQFHKTLTLLEPDLKLSYDGNSTQNESSDDYSTGRINKHLKCVFSFKVYDTENKELSKKIQVIVLNSSEWVAPSVNQLSAFVLRKFDISVCRVSMIDWKEPNTFGLGDSDVIADIESHTFTVTLKDQEISSQLFSRILKYTMRGFKLREIKFPNGKITGNFNIENFM